MKDRLVTLVGGGGFVGRYVAQALLTAGARVRVAQRAPQRAFFLKPLGGLGQTQFVAADVTRPASLARAVAGSDAVVNLVGSFARMQAINADGAGAVAQAAADAGAAAFVHVSAIGADDESPSAYGRSKAAGEAATRAAFPDAIVVRPSIVFGREDAFTNRFAGLAAMLPVMPVLRGAARFQPVYVKDIARAVAAVLADPEAHAGKTYELGGPDVMTMRDVNEVLARMVGRDVGIVDVPDAVGAGIAMLGFLPGAPITADQWKMLQRDTVVTGEDGFAVLGIVPVPLAAVAPDWLVRFRRHGRFGKRQPA
ncbi:complex I NDUFA9 subunit family protein [Sphingomonas sp.]|uniref:complex I NDUFA9 subunit family protein n=1 Tax=Sphingomonas sp. TaxID=28214 RepID=UPI002DD69565|nr:complex I NDUFA9 subunit family protein [Sphingomonas sp.]